MRSNSRRESGSRPPQTRSNSARLTGRVTKEDIRAAHLRRWDGRARITTDWLNLYQEPELCFADGDLLIYLREPGQSSRGPAFRVHQERLREKGFDFLLEKCISRPPICPGTKCLQSVCHGCDIHPSPSELYIPAPANSDLDCTFDHHITTRNFFAWLYDIPLAGRALGRSLVTLKERIDYYRPERFAESSAEMVSYAETQRYLDFRECADHALAALLFAECLQIEDLWIDAFAHCVGMSHRGLSTSVEYWAISYETRLLINRAQGEAEANILFVRQSVCDFYETNLSGNSLGLPQAARDHYDRFRSWLHSYYIERYGFWPPGGFEDDAVEQRVYASLYSDFRNLYHHLLNPDSSTGMTDLMLSSSGGICTIQNIQAYDSRHNYPSLPQTMPLLPREPDLDTKQSSTSRRRSWNPLAKRKNDKDRKRTLRVQAMIAASNRDWTIMECPLVRRYSEFESQIIMDGSETISMVDGRKVRWILIYTILQSLISVMQSPPQVRNTDGVSYFLCCRPPKLLPWQTRPALKIEPTLQKRRSLIEPDAQYNHSNTSPQKSVHNKSSISLSKSLKDIRRQSLPTRIATGSSRPSTARPASIKSFIRRRESFHDEPLPVSPGITKPPAFCEILVHGYGNGLNEIEVPQAKEAVSAVDNNDGEETPKARTPATLEPTQVSSPEVTHQMDLHTVTTDKVPELTPTSSVSVSRESSNASSNSSWSKGEHPEPNETDLQALPSIYTKPQIRSADDSMLTTTIGIPSRNSRRLENLNHVEDDDGLLRTIHFNTETWDNFLGALD